MAVLCFAYLATLLLFYVRSRYRIPAVPFLLVFAGVAVERAITWFRARAWLPLGFATAGLMAAAIFVNDRYCEPPAHGFPQACLGGDTWYDQEWMKLGGWYAERGDIDRAILYMQAATECSAPRGPGQAWFWLGTLEQKKVDALLKQARKDESRQHAEAAEAAYRRCVELRYRLNATYFNLVLLQAGVQNEERAAAAIDEALVVKALDRTALMRIARGQSRKGNCAGAEIVLGRADRDQGFYSDEGRSILSACRPSS
jgi:tetratricopeptide (TPR) repeat protein